MRSARFFVLGVLGICAVATAIALTPGRSSDNTQSHGSSPPIPRVVTTPSAGPGLQSPSPSAPAPEPCLPDEHADPVDVARLLDELQEATRNRSLEQVFRITERLAELLRRKAIDGRALATSGETWPAIAAALGRCQCESCVAVLVGTLRTMDDPGIREAAIRALAQEPQQAPGEYGHLGPLRLPSGVTLSPGAVPRGIATDAVVSALSDRSEDVRAASAWALCWCEDANARMGLLRALREDPSSVVRYAAVSSLSAIASPDIADAIVAAFPTLEEAGQVVAVFALRDIAPDAKAQRLVEMYPRTQSNQVKQSILNAIYDAPTPLAIHSLQVIVKSEQDPDLHASADTQLQNLLTQMQER